RDEKPVASPMQGYCGRGFSFKSRTCLISSPLRAKQAESALRVDVALISGLAVPRHGLNGALRHALAAVKHDPKAELGRCIALVCRLAIPPDRLPIVLRHALAGGKHDPKVELG